MNIDHRFFKMLWKVLILFAFVPVLPLVAQTHPAIGIPFMIGFGAYMTYLIILMHRWVQSVIGELEYEEEEDPGVDNVTHDEPYLVIPNLTDPGTWEPAELGLADRDDDLADELFWTLKEEGADKEGRE